MNAEPARDQTTWNGYMGRLLRDIVHDLWREAAGQRVAEDPQLRRWRREHARAARRSRIAPPPSDALLQLLLGIGWWASFDAMSLAVEPVPAAVDPLHHYSIHLKPANVRARVVAEI